MKIKTLAFLSLIIFNIQAMESVSIPNAKCGNGSDYKVFIDQKKNDKLLVEFMGGGACWDFTSCFVAPHTWIFPVPNLISLSIFSDNNSSLNFLADHSKIYFPYCTGDIHLGQHVGKYANNTKVFHNGYTNVLLALDYLNKTKLIKFSEVNDLVVWGVSAGALASMVHAKKIEVLVKSKAHKTMIIDSPGLHWGKTFWEKFSPQMLSDFERSFKTLNVNLDFSNGLITGQLNPFFKSYDKWHIGFLFATKDIIMSYVFGDISPNDQENLILSKKGMPKFAEKYSNVDVWVTDSYMHTFLLLNDTAQFKSFDDISAINFSQMVYNK